MQRLFCSTPKKLPEYSILSGIWLKRKGKREEEEEEEGGRGKEEEREKREGEREKREGRGLEEGRIPVQAVSLLIIPMHNKVTSFLPDRMMPRGTQQIFSEYVKE